VRARHRLPRNRTYDVDFNRLLPDAWITAHSAHILEHRYDEADAATRARHRRRDTDWEFSADFERQASATNSVSFLGLSPPKASKTVSFFVTFHRGAAQSGILFLVSIERGISRRVYHRRPWLSDMSRLGVLLAGSLRALAVARVGVVGPTRAGMVGGSSDRLACLMLAGSAAHSRYGQPRTTRLYDRRRKKTTRNILERISIRRDHAPARPESFAGPPAAALLRIKQGPRAIPGENLRGKSRYWTDWNLVSVHFSER